MYFFVLLHLYGYRMGSNFHGVQIFVDFVGSLHPRKFYFVLIFGASRDRFASSDLAFN